MTDVRISTQAKDLLMSTTPEQSGGRVAVITGASSGIGEATARDSLVAAACRVNLSSVAAHGA